MHCLTVTVINIQWQPCCRTCRDGTPCVVNFHTQPFPDAGSHSALPQAQAALASTGTNLHQPTDVGQRDSHMPQQTIDLSHDAGVDDSDGDLYGMFSDYAPPYAPHDIVGHRSELPALVNIDRISVGRIVVAAIVIYVTWVTMQVVQRTLEKYLA